MRSMEKHDKIALVLITLYCLSALALITPTRTMAWDDAVHSLLGMFYIDYFTHGLRTGSWDYLGYVRQYHPRFPMAYALFKYPQLYEFTTVPFYALLGPSVLTATLPTVLYSVLTLWFVYAFTRDRLGGNAGLIAMLGVASMPVILKLSTLVVQDHAKLGLTFAWLYYFFKKGEKTKKQVVLQGVLLGLVTFSRNLALPVICSMIGFYLLFKSLKDKKPYLRLVKDFVPQLVIALLMVSPWYYTSLIEVGWLKRLLNLGSSTTIHSFPFYEQSLLLEAGLFAPIMFYGAYKLYKDGKEDTILLASIFFGTLVFGDLFPHKRFRYVLQAVLPMGVWVGKGCKDLMKKKDWFKYVIIALLIVSFARAVVLQRSEVFFTDFEEMTRRVDAGKDDLILYVINNQIDYGKSNPEVIIFEQMRLQNTSNPSEMSYFLGPQYDHPEVPEGNREQRLLVPLLHVSRYPEEHGYNKVFIGYYEQDESVRTIIDSAGFNYDYKIQGENLSFLVFE